MADRPLPKTNEADTRAFWEATRDSRLTYQKCSDCGTVVFYPRRHCTGCLGRNLVWEESAGCGSVYTYSVVRQSYHPFFRDKVPYAVAWIDLDEGPRLLSNVVGVDDPVSDIRIGMRVAVTWEEHDDLCIPLFEPDED
ncbi:MAG: Zn-ribbon domain-containing OB-fold protein [Pseudomonadales bacterium]|jgi:hypothetical protein|nr:Zn-ribbon domain-containing OB-fold protein [Pseudomonadales bacterium]MDP6472340.1 Zn-ribbon domain-containing OB-fold protein [Pseudomonadales bacterium]MDP6828136.1 Zn-ribbon domain-containing OB-fold protein [Pseudomonadales bacterium]MDP6971834.1 Zn-ribbon domain-containing OB-fold protein [Pseudomonadales bacterium]